MNGLLGTAVLLLLVAILLPTIAHLAQAAVPLLLFVIVLAAIVRLARPPRRRR